METFESYQHPPESTTEKSMLANIQAFSKRPSLKNAHAISADIMHIIGKYSLTCLCIYMLWNIYCNPFLLLFAAFIPYKRYQFVYYAQLTLITDNSAAFEKFLYSHTSITPEIYSAYREELNNAMFSGDILGFSMVFFNFFVICIKHV